MRISSFFRGRFLPLTLGCAFAVLFSEACGGKVVVDKSATSSSGGAGGAGGGFSDDCESFGGPLTPDGCKTDGKQCFFADTSCAYTWTCTSGKWLQSGGCFDNGSGP